MQQQHSDLLIDALLDEGFTVEEARGLIQLQERYEEQRAVKENTYLINHFRFVRWLVEQGRLSEW